MNAIEIEKNIYPEDKEIAAVNCECSSDMVRAVLTGRRNSDTELGQKIMAELKRLAEINISKRLIIAA